MLDNFIFENHLGQRFIGLNQGVYLNYNNLRDYSWNYDTINSRISRFYKGITNRKLPLIICCDSEQEAIKVKNRMMELAEVDIEARLPGKVYIGDYYTNGYITGSKKTQYLINKRLCYIELTLTSDDPAWYREQTYSFTPGMDSGGSVSGGIDYPYDYPYDFGAPLTSRNITCGSVSDSGFRIRIYGATVDPAIIVGGHTYAINGTIGVGESLLIDSLNKTITLTTDTGAKVNWFDKRGREQYIFEPIPTGVHLVSWTGSFGFDLTVIEKRSEPRWT